MKKKVIITITALLMVTMISFLVTAGLQPSFTPVIDDGVTPPTSQPGNIQLEEGYEVYAIETLSKDDFIEYQWGVRLIGTGPGPAVEA